MLLIPTGTDQGFYDLGMPAAIDVDPSSVQTNIVLVTVGPDLTDEGVTATVVCERLKAKGVLAMAIMKGVIRFVTHSQVRRGGGCWGGGGGRKGLRARSVGG